MFALIKNGKVVNVIVADAAFASSIAGNWDRVVLSSTAQIGWLDDGVNLTAPPTLIPTVSRKDVILARLAQIDQDTRKPRTIREMQLNKSATRSWMQMLDDEATALRTELAGL